ncbi:MAG: aminotransferase class I/II-fold pyridoxal phosphate-dependent enzyme [Kofleriaceae bacterium]
MKNRVVVITGSTRGIGLALAQACTQRGALVITHGRATEDLATAGGPAALVRRALAVHGRIDVLVNNAATAGDDLATNLIAPMACARAVLASCPAARIVNVSSGLATIPRAGTASYAAAKAGLEAFTRALALDVVEAVVTAVALAGVRTELSRSVLSETDFARLPDVAAALGPLLHAITAPAAEVHGRVLVPPRRPLDRDAADLFGHPLGPSPRAREALAAAVLDRYPAPPVALCKLLAARFEVPLDSVVIGGGIAELLDRVLGVLTRPGEAIVAHVPSWPLVPYLIDEHRLAWRAVHYRLSDGRAEVDLDAVAAAARERAVRVVYLSSPANPSGGSIDHAAFTRFLANVPDHATVVVDEAYAEFAARAEALQAPRLVRTSPRLVVLRTFSKFYGLAGLRIGYAIAAPPLARALDRAAPPFPITAGADAAAAAALVDATHARRITTAVAAARARLATRGLEMLASDAPFVLAADPTAAGPRYFERYVMLPLPWQTTTIAR